MIEMKDIHQRGPSTMIHRAEFFKKKGTRGCIMNYVFIIYYYYCIYYICIFLTKISKIRSHFALVGPH